MKQGEQTTAFESDLNSLIERYRSEFDLHYASAVGVLFMAATNLTNEGNDDKAE